MAIDREIFQAIKVIATVIAIMVIPPVIAAFVFIQQSAG